MRKLVNSLVLWLLCAAACHAGSTIVSSESVPFQNPYVVVGFNAQTGIVTGYFSALLAAPGNTQACKFLFKGVTGSQGRASLKIIDVGGGVHGPAELVAKGKVLTIHLPKSGTPGDCDWILDAVGEPGVRTEKDNFVLSAEIGDAADWLAVGAIGNAKAFFHALPDEAKKKKSFLIAGDQIRIYEERGSWYYVKYQSRGTQTDGWIRKADTVQVTDLRSACAINEQDLLQSWTRSQGGDFEEFKLAREGGVRTFSSWLHHRPEMMGRWTFKECALHVFNDGNDKLSFDYKVLGLSKGILTLQDPDSGETSVYKRSR